jgi:hypothetical protein
MGLLVITDHPAIGIPLLSKVILFFGIPYPKQSFKLQADTRFSKSMAVRTDLAEKESMLLTSLILGTLSVGSIRRSSTSSLHSLGTLCESGIVV